MDAENRINDNIRFDMRRMKVNAQITAMTTALEFLGGLSYLIHLGISKGTSLASFIHFQSIYFILIPYAFLMNTSDNKFRVIQNGWWGVFRNIVGKQVTVGKFEQTDAASDKIVTRNKPSTQTVSYTHLRAHETDS